MKTINELGIYFMCCFIFATLFISYLAVKLRAYRMKNASLNTKNENLQYSLNCSIKKYNEHITESAKILNESAENNAALTKEVGQLKDRIEWLLQDNSATSLELTVVKSERQKLFDMAKGALDTVAKQNAELERVEKILEDEFEQVPIRSVKDLDHNEAIIVESELQCDEVVRLFYKNGNRFMYGKPEKGNLKIFNFCIVRIAGNLFTLTLNTAIEQGYNIVPASDFLPAEQPAPTPVKQLSEVVKDMQEQPLKVGDWVSGKTLYVGDPIEGRITEFSPSGKPIVNGYWLDKSTCKRVPRPTNEPQYGC